MHSGKFTPLRSAARGLVQTIQRRNHPSKLTKGIPPFARDGLAFLEAISGAARKDRASRAGAVRERGRTAVDTDVLS